ncbi:MAG: hypothetical protein ACREAI_06280, partial [Nitrososphaera sp.]
MPTNAMLVGNEKPSATGSAFRLASANSGTSSGDDTETGEGNGSGPAGRAGKAKKTTSEIMA